MRNLSTDVPSKTPPTQATNYDLEKRLHETILREHFLHCALDKAVFRKTSLLAREYEPLLDDLERNQEYLQSLAGGALVPAIAALSSPTAREWELTLFTTFTQKTSRWKPVHRLNHELSQIISLHDQILKDSVELGEQLASHRARIAAHQFLLQNILDQWIASEHARNQPIDQLIDSSCSKISFSWEQVLEEIIEHPESERNPIPIHSWRSLHQIVPLIIQSIANFSRTAPITEINESPTNPKP